MRMNRWSDTERDSVITYSNITRKSETASDHWCKTATEERQNEGHKESIALLSCVVKPGSGATVQCGKHIHLIPNSV